MARRPAEDLLVGIEVGTTDTRSAVFRIDGEVLANRADPADGDCRVEQDTRAAVHQTTTGCPGPRRRVPGRGHRPGASAGCSGSRAGRVARGPPPLEPPTRADPNDVRRSRPVRARSRSGVPLRGLGSIRAVIGRVERRPTTSVGGTSGAQPTPFRPPWPVLVEDVPELRPVAETPQFDPEHGSVAAGRVLVAVLARLGDAGYEQPVAARVGARAVEHQGRPALGDRAFGVASTSTWMSGTALRVCIPTTASAAPTRPRLRAHRAHSHVEALAGTITIDSPQAREPRSSQRCHSARPPRPRRSVPGREPRGRWPPRGACLGDPVILLPEGIDLLAMARR